MSPVSVLLVGSTVTNHAFNDDHRRLVAARFETVNRFSQRFQVVGIVNASNIPTETLESLADVFAECQFGVTFDRDVVVVVQPAQIVQLQMSGDRSGFAGDSFHQVAVAANSVDVVVKQRVIRRVVVCGQPFLGHRHADRVADAGTKRTRGRFNPGRFAEFWVARTDAADLTKVLDRIERNRQACRLDCRSRRRP